MVHALVVVENTAAKDKEVMSGGESGVKLATAPFDSPRPCRWKQREETAS